MGPPREQPLGVYAPPITATVRLEPAIIDRMTHEAPSPEKRRRRPLVIWGAALVVFSVLGCLAAGGAVAAQFGGDLLRALSADPYDTPVELELDLREGTYLVYELTGQSRSVGPVTTTNGHGVTVAVPDVTVTAPDGSKVPVDTPRFDETLNRGTSTYTGAVRFEAEDEGRYRIGVTTPSTRIIVAPSLASMFADALVWFALIGVCAILLLVGVVLLVVGLVRARPPATPSAARSGTPAGWYEDPYGQAALRWWDGRAWTDHLH